MKKQNLKYIPKIKENGMKLISDDGEVKIEKSTDFGSMVGPKFKVTITDKNGKKHVGVGETIEEAERKAKKN